MAVTALPIFAQTPIFVVGQTVTTANTAKDGTGTVVLVYTAGVNGSRIDSIKVRSTGTAVATVLRVFINNGAANTTATNNSLYAEATIAATTLSEVAAQVDNLIAMNISLPATYRVYVTIGTTVAAALQVSAVGGDY
jgi:hypothetical protein